MNLTSGGEHRPLLSLHFNDYATKRKAPLAPLKKKGSKSFMWPALLLLSGKPQGLKTGKTSAAQSPASTLWFTRNVEGPLKSKQSQPAQSGQWSEQVSMSNVPSPLLIHFLSLYQSISLQMKTLQSLRLI